MYLLPSCLGLWALVRNDDQLNQSIKCLSVVIVKLQEIRIGSIWYLDILRTWTWKWTPHYDCLLLAILNSVDLWPALTLGLYRFCFDYAPENWLIPQLRFLGDVEVFDGLELKKMVWKIVNKSTLFNLGLRHFPRTDLPRDWWKERCLNRRWSDERIFIK